jgi:hypothetical protein
MTTIVAVLLLGCATMQPSSPPAEAKPEPPTLKDDGWIQLFNGRNLNGWRENKFKHKPEWKVIDGVLIGHGGQGYLSSLEEFDDFELYAEARISDTAGGRGNSGSISAAHRTSTRNRNFHPATRRSWTMVTVTIRRAASTP